MDRKRFSTFEGVFTPTLLSILGVIMYLRLGWVIGTVGLIAALGIIVFSNLITLATALSMSSIVTNIRIGNGGAFSIIGKSLGMEAGGAIGIPLYLSQAVSVAFYITGFSEAWLRVFPSHNLALVSLAAWFCILLISYYSARMAFRIQYLIMVIVGLSLVSVFMGGNSVSNGIVLKGTSTGHFWIAFAIFFPAVTGVLAGASMSGELIDPKKSIPRGTLSAIVVTFFIYIFLAIWLGFHATAENLTANTAIIIDLGKWKPLVIAGIMGATLSSAISMFVGAPRTLLALGENSLVPGAATFKKINARGEPTPAIMMTSLIVLATFLFGTLDSVAVLLTEFFLITYGMINLSVFIEQSIGIASFRPTFRIPRLVSFLGSIGCFGAMILINPLFTGVAVVFIIGIYMVLIRRELKTRSSDVRSGLLIFMAENFVKAALRLPYHPKIWKPNVFFPTGDLALVRKSIPLLRSIIAPSGRALFIKVIESSLREICEPVVEGKKVLMEQAKQELLGVVKPLCDERLFIEQSVLESSDLVTGVTGGLQLSKEMFFRPNTMFCIIENNGERSRQLMLKAAEQGLGLMALKMEPRKLFGYQKVVNLWVRRNSPNINLAILIALQLQKNWDGEVRIIQAISSREEEAEAYEYLEMLKTTARFPAQTTVEALVGDFRNVLLTAPKADINIFGMAEQPEIKLIHEVFDLVGTSVLFLRDSEFESAEA